VITAASIRGGGCALGGAESFGTAFDGGFDIFSERTYFAWLKRSNGDYWWEFVAFSFMTARPPLKTLSPLPSGRLWYGEPSAIANAISYAKFFSRSHHAVIRV
jgi:hypothetical protein